MTGSAVPGGPVTSSVTGSAAATTSWPAGAQVATFVALLGALAGVMIAVLADTADRSGAAYVPWLRGHGALVVPFTGGPAILAGGWTALAFWRVRHRRWSTAGFAAGLVTLPVAALTTLGPIVALDVLGEDALRGGAGAGLALAITFLAPLILALVAGLALAASLVGITRRAAAAAVATLVAALSVVVVTPGAFFLFGPLLIVPLMVAAPPIVAAGRRRGPHVVGGVWLAVACIALTAGLVAGVIAAQYIQGR